MCILCLCAASFAQYNVRMSVYDYSARSIDGQEQSLADWRGQALLIVNVASRCGFTPQYSGLEALYRRFRARGFAVAAILRLLREHNPGAPK